MIEWTMGMETTTSVTEEQRENMLEERDVAGVEGVEDVGVVEEDVVDRRMTRIFLHHSTPKFQPEVLVDSSPPQAPAQVEEVLVDFSVTTMVVATAVVAVGEEEEEDSSMHQEEEIVAVVDFSAREELVEKEGFFLQLQTVVELHLCFLLPVAEMLVVTTRAVGPLAVEEEAARAIGGEEVEGEAEEEEVAEQEDLIMMVRQVLLEPHHKVDSFLRLLHHRQHQSSPLRLGGRVDRHSLADFFPLRHHHPHLRISLLLVAR